MNTNLNEERNNLKKQKKSSSKAYFYSRPPKPMPIKRFKHGSY